FQRRDQEPTTPNQNHKTYWTLKIFSDQSKGRMQPLRWVFQMTSPHFHPTVSLNIRKIVVNFLLYSLRVIALLWRNLELRPFYSPLPSPSKNCGFACTCSYSVCLLPSVAKGKNTCGISTISVSYRANCAMTQSRMLRHATR